MEWPTIISSEARMRVFGPAELQRLRILRLKYQLQPHIFSECELGRLRFLRWLIGTGQLQVG